MGEDQHDQETPEVRRKLSWGSLEAAKEAVSCRSTNSPRPAARPARSEEAARTRRGRSASLPPSSSLAPPLAHGGGPGRGIRKLSLGVEGAARPGLLSSSSSARLGASAVAGALAPQPAAAAAAARRWPVLLLRRRSERVLENRSFSVLMTVLTMFVLVGDDVRLVCFESPADEYFNWMTVACFLLFTLEIVLSSLVKEDYFLGFWFLADIFASASLIFDLTLVSNAMMNYPEVTAENMDGNTNSNTVQGAEYARASRSSRVGTRVARLLRVVRLVRLGRILRAFQRLIRPRRRSCLGRGMIAPGDSADVRERQAESRVGRKLSERTTQRVILLVLAMLVVVPQLNIGDHFTMMLESAQYGADVVFQAWQDYELAATGNRTGAESVRRSQVDWEMQVLTYIYYHNWYAACPGDFSGECADSWLHRLCWVGYVDRSGSVPTGDAIDVAREGYIRAVNRTEEWDTLFSGGIGDGGASRKYMVGNVPEDIKAGLARPWATDCTESGPRIRGVSLLAGMPCPRKVFRLSETLWYTPVLSKKDFFDRHMEAQFLFVFDVRKANQWEAILGISQTAFVVIVLAIGALLFSRDVDMLVLLPIERMISKVEIIRQDPLYAIRLGDLQYKEDKAAASGRSSLGGGRHHASSSRKGKLKQRQKSKPVFKKATLETKILENAIIKLGSLLALGFGEAGSEIIGQNLDDDNATVNAMIPGSKVDAIYGFCDIRNFATTTEVLQEKTMVFVNQVAEIVHRIVDEHLGAANKNVGEAFLLVWRIGLYTESRRSKISDLAVMSFIQVVAQLNRDRKLAEYREHPALLARLPDFRVSLGFGLHLGWSIEGAIGSEFKIDASYLSPHVNVATRLGAATEEYGVAILLSEPLVRSCAPAFSRHFRPVDRVKLRGSNMATRVFTVDLHFELLPVESAIRETRRKTVNRFEERQEREQRKFGVLLDSHKVHQVFDTDRYVRRMRERFSMEFFQEFEKGYLNYEAGEWDVAEKVLSKASGMLRGPRGAGDGPSRMLLDYMQGFGFQAPTGWPGWRELRER